MEHSHKPPNQKNNPLPYVTSISVCFSRDDHKCCLCRDWNHHSVASCAPRPFLSRCHVENWISMELLCIFIRWAIIQEFQVIPTCYPHSRSATAPRVS